MQPELPENYYLDNVQTLFAHVSRVYHDLLYQGTRDFLNTFATLGPEAQKLLVRLLNRSHDCYRASKLNYPEITDIDAAIDQLAQHRCIAVDAEIDNRLLLSLYTKSELLALGPDSARHSKLRRNELEVELIEHGGQKFFHRLKRQDRLLHLLTREHYSRCQMLFFGNLNQSMTDFVLRDLGLNQFEAYPIDPQHRPYRNRVEIEQHWLLYQLEELFSATASDSADQLEDLLDLLPTDIDVTAPAYRKGEHLRYQITRQLERCGQIEAALASYRRCTLPPSRERITRITARQQPAQALDLCRQILEQPIDEDEIQFAANFAARLARRHNLELPSAAARQQITQPPPMIDLELEYSASVEMAVADYFTAADGAQRCYYLENSLFNGVLGLLIWEAIFAPLAGAFFNPFQHRPSDFYAPDFCRRRQEILTRSWSEVDSVDDIRHIVSRRWQQKFGLMNPLVNWQALEPGVIELALERIEYRHWRAIFTRILADLRHNRAGFPDLVHFPPDGGYCLIEVKGPGDSLQNNQRRWMQYFAQHDIPHCVARVKWRQE